MDDKVTEKERYEIIHKMSRRVASVDKYCVVSVSNKAFEEYFGHIVDTLLEVVAPQDKERLINFIDNYDEDVEARSDLEDAILTGINDSSLEFTDVEIADAELAEMPHE